MWRAGTEATNMSRWVDVEEIADKWELTVKEDGKSDPMGVREVKRVEGLGTKGMCMRLILIPRSEWGRRPCSWTLCQSSWQP